MEHPHYFPEFSRLFCSYTSHYVINESCVKPMRTDHSILSAIRSTIKNQSRTWKTQQNSRNFVSIQPWLVPRNPLTISLVCDPHADITFRSSDDVLFKIHSKYLEATSARLFTFAERKTSEFDDQAPLDETSEILEILFQFVHPPGEGSNHQQPSIMDIKPEIFFAVAGASEKYVVFGAMSIFMLHMQYVFDSRDVSLKLKLCLL